MQTSLRSILLHFPAVKPVRFYDSECTRDYRDIIWMGVFDGAFRKNYIYIGKMSDFPEIIPEKELALLLINDIDRDICSLGVEAIELCPDINLAELCLQIHNQLFQNNYFPEIADILLNGLFSSCSINEILDAAYAHLNNPIMITFSQNHTNLYYSCNAESRHAFQISSEELRRRESAAGYTQMCREIKKTLDPLLPVFVNDGDFLRGHRRVLASLTQGSSSHISLGVLVVFEVNQPITERDVALISVIRQLISDKCTSPLFRETLSVASYEQRLQALIRGESLDEDLSWINTVFGKPPYDFSLAMIDIRAMSSYQVEAVQYTLTRTLCTNIHLARGSFLIAITNLADRDISVYMDQLKEFSKTQHITIAVSSRFQDLTRLKKYYTQAKLVLKYAQHFQLTDCLCEFPLLKADVMVHEFASKAELSTFACDGLERLITFDKENGTEYYPTLMAYLDSCMNREKTREQMHIHRNTLSYRLDRIEEILGLRLNNGSNLLNLYLSNIIHQQLQ